MPTPEDFNRWYTAIMGAPPAAPVPFQPMARYDADGDIIEFLAHGCNWYGEHIMPGLVVYLDRDNGEIVGVCIEGVSPLIFAAKLPRNLRAGTGLELLNPACAACDPYRSAVIDVHANNRRED